MPICDMIKGNESDVADVVFVIPAKEVTKFFCFILFLTGDNLLLLCNQVSIFDIVWIKM